MTALTVYGANAASSSISTADKMFTGTGATGVVNTTKIGKNTGYGEVFSQGTTGTWASAGSIGSQSGHGWLWDVTTLEGQSFPTGNWHPTITLNSSSGTSCTADIICRISKWHSGPTYTTIGTITLTGQSITSTTTAYDLLATSLGSVDFATGDKLYVDLWLNITVATGSTTATMNVSMGNSTTQGTANDMQIVTPGYSPSATTTTYSFTDALSADDSASAFVSVALPIESLTASDTLLTTDTDLAIEANAVSDNGGLFRWPVDSLTIAESIFFVESAIPTESLSIAESLLQTGSSFYTEANSASDSLGGGIGVLLTESLSTSDSLLQTESAAIVDGLTGTEVDLSTEVYRTIDALSADDSASTMVQSSPGVVTTTYSFTEALAASESILQIDSALLIEANSASDSFTVGNGSQTTESLATSDSLLESDGYIPLDALVASDIGNATRGFVDALVVSDTFMQADSYLPADVQSVAESLQASISAKWVDLLIVSDSLTAVISSPQPPQFLTATWVTRDGVAVWVTRDERATWDTRDDLATWKTRS